MVVHSASPRATISSTFLLSTVLTVATGHASAQASYNRASVGGVARAYLTDVFRSPFLTSSSIVSCRFAKERIVCGGQWAHIFVCGAR